MIVKIALPPNYLDIVEKLQRPPRGAIFAWGETIFNPDAGSIDATLIAHEATHAKQQELHGGPKAWWDRYLTDAAFRLQQEVEAYRAQYAKACQLLSSRQTRRAVGRQLAGELSSPMYRLGISRDAAQALIVGSG